MKRYVLLLLFLLGCDNQQTSTICHSGSTQTQALISRRYDVDTIRPDSGCYSSPQAHDEIVKWIETHPDRNIISIVSYSGNYGCYGISIISTSTK